MSEKTQNKEKGSFLEFIGKEEYEQMIASFPDREEVGMGEPYKAFGKDQAFESPGAVTCTQTIVWSDQEHKFIVGHYINFSDPSFRGEDSDRDVYEIFLAHVSQTDGEKQVFLFGENSQNQTSIVDDLVAVGVDIGEITDQRINRTIAAPNENTADSVFWNPSLQKLFVYRGDA
jgi:hypothetical protein